MVDVTIDDKDFQKALQSLASTLPQEAQPLALLAAAQELRNEVIPRTPYLTGTYRRSIRTEREGADVLVGSDVPYGPRLEYGFVGRDRLGRNYHQGPRPHWRPAIEASKDAQLKAAAAAAEKLLGRLK